jgi:hypothetical protein
VKERAGKRNEKKGEKRMKRRVKKQGDKSGKAAKCQSADLALCTDTFGLTSLIR